MSLRRLPLALAVVMLLVAATAAFADQTERVQRTVPLSPGGTLKLNNFSGRVTITATDRSEVVIDAVRRAPQERLDRIKLDIQSSGSTVTIEANKKISSGWFKNDVVETEMNIQVPRHTDLQVHVFSSPVNVTDVGGHHQLKAFSGELRLAGVTGSVTAETFNGNIELQLAAADERPELDLHTFSGDVNLLLPATARAGVDFDSFSGDLASDVPLTLRTKSKRSVKGELNASGGDAARNNIVIKTFSGDVRIRK
jgi:DUF4097 and DUF4098 domain-containing protein YvlB